MGCEALPRTLTLGPDPCHLHVSLPRALPTPSQEDSQQWFLAACPVFQLSLDVPQPGSAEQAALQEMQEGVSEPRVHILLCTDEKSATPLVWCSAFLGLRQAPVILVAPVVPFRPLERFPIPPLHPLPLLFGP